MYIILDTRPDIAYAVSVISRFSANPIEVYISTVKRVFLVPEGYSVYRPCFSRRTSAIFRLYKLRLRLRFGFPWVGFPPSRPTHWEPTNWVGK
jgi:hypothetical protein